MTSRYGIVLSLLFLLLSIQPLQAGQGEGVSEVGTLISINTVQTKTVIPIAKFNYAEEVDGLVWGSRILGILGIGEAVQGGLKYFLEEVYLFLQGEGISYAMGETPYLFGDNTTPEKVVIAFNAENSSDPVGNDDILFLFEYEDGDEIEVGIPHLVEYNYHYLKLATDGNAPKYANIISAEALNPSYESYEYMSVLDAGYQMLPQPPLFDREFSFFTIGVVSGYVDLDNTRYMILKAFVESEFLFVEALGMYFVAVDMSGQSNHPEIGSVVQVAGSSKRINYLIEQEMRFSKPQKVIQKMIPDNIAILNGSYGSDIPLNTSLFYIFGKADYQLVGIQWAGLAETPDFSISFPPFQLFDYGAITVGDTYTLRATVENNGTVTGAAVAEFYHTSMSEENLIGKVEIENLRSLYGQDIELEWNTSDLQGTELRNVLVIAVVKNAEPAEDNLINNYDYFEQALYGAENGAMITAYCPVTLEVSLADGSKITYSENSIDGAEYEMYDYNNDGRLDHRVYLPEAISSEQAAIKVVPLEDADPEEPVTIELFDDNAVTVIADSIAVEEIEDSTFNVVVTGVEKTKAPTPTAYELFTNYPNPFNPSTTISYAIPEAGYVSLKVYDTTGRLVETLVSSHKPAGRYEVSFNAEGLPSGTYLYRLTAGSYSASGKMMLLK